MEGLGLNNKGFEDFTNQVEKIVTKITGYNNEDDVSRLNQLVANFKTKTEDFYRENRKLNIGVVGQVKAGKSSFLNTLLFNGEEILPKASTPKTATLTKMEYSEQNIIQIEYYSVDEWSVLEDNAAVDLEDEIYTSAREIVSMIRRNGLDPKPYLEKGVDKLEFNTYDDLIANLNNYVGEDGKFTPIVKAVTLYLNKEEFKGLSIVDTPGLNDPIASRTIRTKEFMELCDVVFFLSQSSSFLDKSDWTLLSSQLPQKGVKKLVLIASKYDSGVRDVLRLRDEDDEFDCDDDNTADHIPEAYNIIKKKLTKRAKEKIKEFVKDLQIRESARELINVIEQCAEPVLVSAMACNMAKKSEAEYSKEELNVYKALKVFSNDMVRDLELLGNFKEVNAIFDEVVLEKENILEQKARSFIPTAQEELHDNLKQFKEKVEKRIAVLVNTDREKLAEQKNIIASQINSIRADVVSVFGELNSNLEVQKAECVQAMRNANSYYLDIKERVGEKVHRERYTVSTSKWYNPFSWGSSREETSTWTERYSYALASDAIDNLNKYSVESVNHIEKVFAETMDYKELKRKLLNVVVNNFDMGSEQYDSALFRLVVEESISDIELPIFSINTSNFMNDIAANFTGELTSVQKRTELKTALSVALSRIYEELLNRLTDAVSNFKKELKNVSDGVQNKLLENIQKEFDVLLAQFEHKEQEIAMYKSYIEVLEGEMSKL